MTYAHPERYLGLSEDYLGSEAGQVLVSINEYLESGDLGTIRELGDDFLNIKKVEEAYNAKSESWFKERFGKEIKNLADLIKCHPALIKEIAELNKFADECRSVLAEFKLELYQGEIADLTKKHISRLAKEGERRRQEISARDADEVIPGERTAEGSL